MRDLHPHGAWSIANGLPWGKFTLSLGRIAQIRGSLCKRVVIPSQASHEEGVETVRASRKVRDSPDHEPERGGENRSGKHNPLVPGSTPGGPTNSKNRISGCGFFCSDFHKAEGRMARRLLRANLSLLPAIGIAGRCAQRIGRQARLAKDLALALSQRLSQVRQPAVLGISI